MFCLFLCGVVGGSGRRRRLAEDLLRGVHDVEEAVLVALALVQLAHRHRHGRHAALVDQQEKSLVRMELKSASGKRKLEIKSQLDIFLGVNWC